MTNNRKFNVTPAVEVAAPVTQTTDSGVVTERALPKAETPAHTLPRVVAGKLTHLQDLKVALKYGLKKAAKLHKGRVIHFSAIDGRIVSRKQAAMTPNVTYARTLPDGIDCFLVELQGLIIGTAHDTKAAVALAWSYYMSCRAHLVSTSNLSLTKFANIRAELGYTITPVRISLR